MFDEAELAFLAEQQLLRMATVDNDGQPTVDAVGFQFDGSRFYISGMNLMGSRKGKNVAAGNTKVSLIIDDLLTVRPWQPRGIKVHGVAEVVEHDGHLGKGTYLAVTPVVSWSWGIEGSNYQAGKFKPKKINWRTQHDGER